MFDILAVFHGGSEEILYPKVDVGRPQLDFGPGFYVTDIYSQAKEWAKKMAERRSSLAVVNTYHLNQKELLETGNGLIFPAYDKDWLEFVTQSRLGKRPWQGYDYIEGGVADDNVFDTLRLYINGFISSEDALQRLKYFRPSNQICILNQTLLDTYLEFVKSEII